MSVGKTSRCLESSDRSMKLLITSVVASHPVGSLQVGDLASDEVGEDADPLVVVVLLEDLLVPEVQGW